MSRRPPLTGRQKVAAAAVAVVATTLAALVVVRIASSGDVSRRLGRSTFRVGQADSLAERIEADGGLPLLFADLLGRDRDIYVVHLGGRRWAAFEAHAPGRPRRCQLAYDPATRRFRDPCGRATYPLGGDGLVRYRTFVRTDGALFVDLRRPLP